MKNTAPRLRALDIRRVDHDGRRFLLLRDPIGLAPGELLVPVELGTLLALCNGATPIEALRREFHLRTGIGIDQEQVLAVIAKLDDSLMLEGKRVAIAAAKALAEYREASFRQPVLSGLVYPSDADDLRRALDEYGGRVGVTGNSNPGTRRLAGILTPHIDFQRGFRTYARAWSIAAPMLADVEVAVIFGTDHAGGPGRITLTRQNYATPLGVLPTEKGSVDAIVDVLGEEAAFAEELHHRQEHSLELTSVWLHHALGGQQIEIVPVLCGYLPSDSNGTMDAETVTLVDRMLSVLSDRLKGRRTVVIAGADLAHVGPAFGDPTPLDAAARTELSAKDRESLDIFCAGNADSFFQNVHADADARRICGISPMYLMLRYLRQIGEADVVSYEHCPADPNGGSIVSIAGALLFE